MAFVLVSLFPVLAQRQPDAAVKADLQKLMQELKAAVDAKDRAGLERIYADEFLFVHALGAPVARKDHIDTAIASTSSGALPIPSFDGLLVYGDVAIHRQHVDGRFSTTIFARKEGRWQIVQQQGTPIPTTRPTVSVPADVLQSYAGRYEQDNGLFVTIAAEGGTLALQVDGRQKFILTADSDDRFSLPGAAGQFTFRKKEDGTMTYQLVRSNGVIVNGVRRK
jgi:ketosteroid isomerase-like protein